MPSGSKPISGFPDGSPPQNADDYVFERAGVTYRIPYATLQAAIIAAIGPITAGSNQIILVESPESVEDSIVIPGERGIAGIGTPGISGRDGSLILIDPDLPEDPQIIPGDRGIQGIPGVGSIGRDGALIPAEEIYPDDPVVILPRDGINGINGLSGTNTLVVLQDEQVSEENIIPGPKGDVGAPGSSGSGSASLGLIMACTYRAVTF